MKTYLTRVLFAKFSIKTHIALLILATLSACSSNGEQANQASTSIISELDQNETLQYEENQSIHLKVPLSYYSIHQNKTAYIPPQCYTKVNDVNSATAYNPCYSCHTNSVAPNFVNDSDVQIEYLFANYATKNRYTNLFENRSEAVANIDHATIQRYINRSNYFDENGSIILQKRLATIPKEWDSYPDGRYNGYVPDCYFNFDENGFDRRPDGNYTRWRAFGYYPFLGTFWPTNGSTDDVLIRLPELFATDENGAFNLNVYHANLTIIEMLIKQHDINVSIDETLIQTDLNGDGNLSLISTLALPLTRDAIIFAGKAQDALANQRIEIDFGLFPVGTEFLHSVRYIAADNNGSITLSKRLKELRYAFKSVWLSAERHQIAADLEATEKVYYPDSIKTFNGDSETGLNNRLGWKYHAFIEDEKGDLRPQNYEELVYCMGCHGMIGATTDTIFTFKRKMDANAYQKGWFHWSQQSLKGISEPKRSDGEYEYSYYLHHNGAGDEFRDNREIINRFFLPSNELNSSALTILHSDISYLLYPSYERAMALNKAYYQIVLKQSYIYGRDATIYPVANVLESVNRNDPTGIDDALLGY